MGLRNLQILTQSSAIFMLCFSLIFTLYFSSFLCSVFHLGNLPVGVVIICTFGFGVIFLVWCYFVLKGASATVLDVVAWGKVRK